MKLAINGAEKVRSELFPSYNTIGEEEKRAVDGVLDTGILSNYIGGWGEAFYGGTQVKKLEEEWAEYFGGKYAVAVNSATSALMCAVGAAGIKPGDEVIVSPYTMCASATAPLIYNAVPVFADIEEEYFCLDPKSVEERITPRTKAIIVVNIFGQPHNADRIREIADRHGLFVIEDNAQGPGATYNGRYAGNLGDVGVFSLNYHKHIHCGEGGIAVTDDLEIAERLQLIRNHAEAVVEAKGYTNLINMIGFNMRMTEMEAAVARVQLTRLRGLIDERIANVEYLYDKLSDIPCLKLPPKRNGVKHVYYMQPILYDAKDTGVDRDRFIEAVKAELMPSRLREREGVLIRCGYVKPLYQIPMYQSKIGYGSDGYPFTEYVNYPIGLCPVCEDLYSNRMVTNDLIHPGLTKQDLDDIATAFKKVYDNIDELR